LARPLHDHGTLGTSSGASIEKPTVEYMIEALPKRRPTGAGKLPSILDAADGHTAAGHGAVDSSSRPRDLGNSVRRLRTPYTG